MSLRGRTGALVCAILFFACMVFALKQADQTRAATNQQYMYLPSKTILKHFSVGMNSVIANLLWLECIQYTGRALRSDQDYQWIEHMARTATALDPHFVELYQFGGMFLASLKGDGDAAISLLEDGFIQNPFAWKLPYEIAMVHLLNRGDDPNAKCFAQYYVGMSLATGNAPEFVQQLYDGLKDQCETRTNDPCGDLAFEAQTYQRLFETGEQVMQDVARQKMELVQLRQTCCDLMQFVEHYKGTTGQAPENLDALIKAGIIQGIPADPSGGHFFIDSDGLVKNTTVLDDQISRFKVRIETALQKYLDTHGEYPPTLEILRETKTISHLPAYPYASKDWGYNPRTGELN